MTVHPIEAESYRILEGLVDLSAFGLLGAAVVARVVHASADPRFAEDLAVDEAAARAGVDALRAGAPVVTDVEMVRAGLCVDSRCHLRGAPPVAGLTRAASGLRRAAGAHPRGAVVVVGCAPTALAETVRLHAEGAFSPALVVGLPVGFVGAVEAKAALRASGLPAISNVSARGGSAVAAAALNALARVALGA